MLYENKSGSISQDAKKTVYLLSFKGKEYAMHFCEFLNIHKKIAAINIEECLLGTDAKHDTHKLVLFRSNKVLKLTLSEIIGIKDLFEGAMFDLKVRDLIYRSNEITVASMQKELAF